MTPSCVELTIYKNHFAYELVSYKSVPDFLQEVLVAYGLGDPQELGLPRANLADLQGGTPEGNAAIIRRVFEGEPGPRRDIVLLNAAALLLAAGTACDMQDGLELAGQAIDSGHALRKVDALVAFTQQVSP